MRKINNAQNIGLMKLEKLKENVLENTDTFKSIIFNHFYLIRDPYT